MLSVQFLVNRRQVHLVNAEADKLVIIYYFTLTTFIWQIYYRWVHYIEYELPSWDEEADAGAAL